MPTGAPLASFEAGHIVKVPFPYTDRNLRQFRPALVVSDGPVGAHRRLLWVVMITSAENSRWPDDVEIAGNLLETGLPEASLVRPSKIATIEAKDAEILGQLQGALLDRVKDRIRQILRI